MQVVQNHVTQRGIGAPRSLGREGLPLIERKLSPS